MASATGKRTIVVNVDLEFTITPAKFEPNTNLDHIDVKLTSKKAAKIEAGELIGNCCSTKVYGIVENDMVSRIEFGKCKGSKSPPKFLESAVAKAIEAIRPEGKGSFEPMPVSAFISRAKRRFIDIDIGGGCVTICIAGFCYFCCVLDRDTLCGEPIVIQG